MCSAGWPCHELSHKSAFWSDFEMFMQEIPPNEVITIGADKNGYLGETNLGHEGFGTISRDYRGI